MYALILSVLTVIATITFAKSAYGTVDSGCDDDPVCMTDSEIDMTTEYLSTPSSREPGPTASATVQNATHPEAPDPQPYTEFVVGPDCTHLHQSCAPIPQNTCTAEIDDYQRRLAADPTIPVEDWEAGHLVHFDANGVPVAVDPPSCENVADPAPADSNPPPRVVTDHDALSAFRTIPLPVPAARMSPPFPACVHLNVANYVYVDPVDTAPVTVTLLGTPVTVFPRVVDYTWDFGDGTRLTTEDPGAAWPHGTVSHMYRTPGRYQVTVTLRWAADWESPKHPRSPVPGETTTISAPGIAWVHEVRVVLVNDPDAALPTKPHDPADACYQR